MVIKYDKPKSCYACNFHNESKYRGCFSCALCKETITEVGVFNVLKERADICPFDHPENARFGFCIQDCTTVDDWVEFVAPYEDPMSIQGKMDMGDFIEHIKRDLAYRLAYKMMQLGLVTFSTNGVLSKRMTQRMSASADVIGKPEE